MYPKKLDNYLLLKKKQKQQHREEKRELIQSLLLKQNNSQLLQNYNSEIAKPKDTQLKKQSSSFQLIEQQPVQKVKKERDILDELRAQQEDLLKQCHNKVDKKQVFQEQQQYKQILDQQIKIKQQQKHNVKEDEFQYFQTVQDNCQIDKDKDQKEYDYRKKKRYELQKITYQTMSEKKKKDQEEYQKNKTDANIVLHTVNQELEANEKKYKDKTQLVHNFMREVKNHQDHLEQLKHQQNQIEYEDDHNYQQHYINNIKIQDKITQEKLAHRLDENNRKNFINLNAKDFQNQYLKQYNQKINEYAELKEKQMQYLDQIEIKNIQENKVSMKNELLDQIRQKEMKKKAEIDGQKYYVDMYKNNLDEYKEYQETENGKRKRMALEHQDALIKQIQEKKNIKDTKNRQKKIIEFTALI